MYDVIIIGAGPSGSTAAKILAEKGYKTLLAKNLKCHVISPVQDNLLKKQWIWYRLILVKPYQTIQCALQQRTKE